jgi:hypothetical protein
MRGRVAVVTYFVTYGNEMPDMLHRGMCRRFDGQAMGAALSRADAYSAVLAGAARCCPCVSYGWDR